VRILGRVLLAALVLAQSPGTGETIVSSPRAQTLATDTGSDHVVVTAEELASTGERSLPRQISKAAGVWLQETNLGGGSPLVQGLSGNQVLLVVDGARTS
jgi:outer membrane receptor for ferrienterochelin and colicin